ncbi:malonyl-CoA decarboxylase-domain-containing protein [Haematococcus lacustris]
MGLQLVSEVYQDLDLDLELEDLLGSPSQHSPAQSPSPGGEEAQQQGQVQQEQFWQQLMRARAPEVPPEQAAAVHEQLRAFATKVYGGVPRGLIHYYTHTLQPGTRPAFLHLLATRLGVQEHVVGDAISQWQRALLLSSQTAASSSAGSPGPTSSTSTSTPLATSNASSQGGSASSEYQTGRSHSLADAGASSSSSSGREGGQGGGGAAEAERLSKAADRLAAAARPLYCHLLLPVSKEPGGIRFLTQLRADVLQLLRRQPAYNTPLRGLAEHLRQALAAWFTPGLLECQRLSWEGCSGALLDKVAAYEAVHPILGWADLRRRFDPHDRRVHAWFHPCLPGEPLIILHAALMQSVPHTLTQLLLPPSSSPLAMALDTPPSSTPAPLPSPAPLPPTIPRHRSSSSSSTCSPSAASPTTASSPAAPPPRPLPTVAAFYSISATQPGLSGVDLGHALIQRVAYNLQAEFPSVTQLVTLSPLPGFRTWLTSKLLQQQQQQQQTTQAQATHSPGERPLPWDQGQGPQGQSAAAAAAVPPPAQPLPPILLPSDQQLLLSSGADAGQLLALLLEQQAWLQDPSAEPGSPQVQGTAAGEAGAAGAGAGAEAGRHGSSVGVSAAEGAGWSGAAATRWPLQVSRLELEAAVRGVLLRAAARYLLQERRRSLAVDPVAHFHLSNGASVWRLNWGADLSQEGWRSSCGIMVNYQYQPDTMDTNNEAYLVKKQIQAAGQVRALLATSDHA